MVASRVPVTITSEGINQACGEGKTQSALEQKIHLLLVLPTQCLFLSHLVLHTMFIHILPSTTDNVY